MFERDNRKPGTGRLRTTLAIAAVTAVVASLAIVGTVAAQPGQRFLDVPRTHYAYDSIEWAVTNGITYGCGDGRNFCPEQTLTRAHMVTFLKRYHDKFHGTSATDTSDDSDDSSDPEEYAVDGWGTDDESIRLPAGRYSVAFSLEHVGFLDEFEWVELRVEDSSGREERLFRHVTATLADVDSFTRRTNFEVGDRLGLLDPGTIYFEVEIMDKTGDAFNRVFSAEWEIFVTER